uniref:UDP-glycosyltransferase 88B1-like n=1 Tax=Erigeron canadensis TaxID=72917 RepID=UPI001CB9CEBB|nr:UDP-glycosyltransferase 88B1-like [Erigeron canadensis]
MENIVVMFPSLQIGHLVSMVELGKLIITADDSLAITILLTPQHYENKSTADYVKTITSTTPSITFHYLPTLSQQPDPSAHFFDLVFQLITAYKPILRDTLLSISQKSSIKGVIIDFLSNDAFDVCRSLDIPTYYLFTNSAFGLGVMLYLRTIHKNTTESFKDLKSYIQVPGVPPIFSLDMPGTLLDRNTFSYKNILNISNNMAKSQGIINNSFAALEQRVVKTLADGEHIPDGPTPPIYYVGPLIRNVTSDNAKDKSIQWLDSQPPKSVVVLIFGSMGKFKKDQLMEMANGLEKSGQRFLWVVRDPPQEFEKGHEFAKVIEPDLEDLLPSGFIDRNKEKGLVLKNWAPQGEILRHGSVGGFVCHCGWNSVLEALNAGVPMLAWPLYAEQKMNRVSLVEGMKVALRLEMSEDGFVTADELAARLKELMEEESGMRLKEHVSAISKSAKAAVADGGSSRVAVVELIKSLKSA